MNTSKKALEHIIWRFENSIKNNKPINPSENDLKAINKLSQSYTDKKNENINNNTLFAKLYIVFYGELLKYFDSTVFDNTPQKALHKILDTPIQNIIHKFINKANLQEQTIVHNTKNGFKHPKQVDTSDIEPNATAMTYQEAEDNLTSLINLALNQYE